MKIEVETTAEMDACLLELSEATGKAIPVLARNCLEAEVFGQLAFLRRKKINRLKPSQKSGGSSPLHSPALANITQAQ